VLRVAAGGERVRRGLIDDEDPRRRKARGLGDAADDPVELRRFGFGHRLRARERERDAVAEPPGAEVQDERDGNSRAARPDYLRAIVSVAHEISDDVWHPQIS